MAPIAERKRRDEVEEYPDASRQLKAMKRREKQVALAESMRKELQIWVERIEL